MSTTYELVKGTLLGGVVAPCHHGYYYYYYYYGGAGKRVPQLHATKSEPLHNLWTC